MSTYLDLSDVPDGSAFLGIQQASTLSREKTEFTLYSAWTQVGTGPEISYFLCKGLHQEEEKDDLVTLRELERELALYREYSQQTDTRIDPRLEYFNKMMHDKFVVDVVESRYKDSAIDHLMNLGKYAPRTYTFNQLFTEPLNGLIAPESLEALYALHMQDSFDWPVLDTAFVKALPTLHQVGANLYL